MSVRLVAILAAASAIAPHAVRPQSAYQGVRASTSSVIAYEAFRRKFGIDRVSEDEGMLHHRAGLFEQRSSEVKAHNARKRGWVKAVNKFADLTKDEFRSMLGHVPSQRAPGVGSRRPVYASSFAALDDGDLLEAVDYRFTLNASLPVKNQGPCGSCWAVAVAGAMETHAEAHATGHVPTVSYEQLVDCVENPEECGGTGGCQGATSELAFQYIKDHGIGLTSDYTGYQSGGDFSCRPPGTKAMTIGGYVRLPENEVLPLREALANHGPVVVSAEATEWMLYDGGVFDGCGPNAIVNHAILMMGYGEDSETHTKFWLIRNSWGTDWGEDGYLRLLRHSDSESFCGIDSKPADGVGCKGGPATVPVCGMCGILLDSAYPTEVEIVDHIL